MKTLLLFLLTFSTFEVRAEKLEEVPSWATLATNGKPEGKDFEMRFRSRHFYLLSPGFCTRVPRESILNLPEKYQSAVAEKPEGTQVCWIEFVSANGSWLRHQDVTWPQVLGEVALSQSKLKGIESSGRLVIATYQGGPVTVLSQDTHRTDDVNPNPRKK